MVPALAVAALISVFAQPPGEAPREAAYRANNVGVAQLEQFDYDAAARSFREALKLHPALDIGRLNLAIALFYGGKTADALAEARAAVERLPDAPQAHYVLGLIARAEDELDAAASAFERVLKIDPADAGAKVNLGQIALQQREYDKALSLFRDAVAAEPYNVTAAYSIALALMRSGKTDEGRKAMQQFESLRDSAYGITYAQTYLSQGKYAEAVASTGAEPELVNPATPPVTFSDATSTMLPQARRASAAGRGGVTLFDADGDGDLDLLQLDGTGQRFLRNERGVFTDETARVGLTGAGDGTRLGAIAGDYDNDGRSDLFVLRSAGHSLLHQKADRSYEDVTAASGIRLAASQGEASAAFADVDHDGDLDIVVAGSPTALLRNNGNGTFVDIAGQAGIGAPVRASAVAATDFDNRRDIDVVIASADGPLLLYRNLRDGSFRNAAAESGLPPTGGHSALAAGDLNKDGFTDLFLGRPDQPALLALSDGQTRFRMVAAPDTTRAAAAAQFVDYDNDGLLDLFVIAAQRARLLRNVGSGKWSDVTDAARVPPFSAETRPEAIALGDLDGDGDTDAIIRLSGGDVRAWRNEGGNRNGSLRVRLSARVSNRGAIGTKVELRAGSLRQQLETSASSPATAPADLIFGLGSRTGADVVRALWPSGILQAETGAGSAPIPRGSMTINELDRKPSSCPYLFTWNGERFEFVTDLMGGGEMGAWLAPGIWNHPDPDEYVRVTGNQLQPRKGRYELRLTNELEEALFVDRMQLVAIDHEIGVDVFPNEGLKSPPHPAFALTPVRSARPPLRAVDEHGHDVLPKISARDRKYPDDFALLPIRGYAEPHSLTLTVDADASVPPASARTSHARVGEAPRRSSPPEVASGERRRASAGRRDVLLLTGWTDYAFSNDNVAASQRAMTMRPPSLEVKDAAGKWKTVVKEIGFPVGRPQTVVVDLAGKWLSASRDVRISTNMRIYWDQILVASRDEASPPRMTRLDPAAADLRWRGFSAETTPDGRQPFGYDYARVSVTAPWKTMVGRYTREGDVRALLTAVDDMYVISRPGDELAVAFDAKALPALPSDWARTFLVFVHGYSKEMNPRSAEPELVGPLPFFGMSGYPYRDGEHYPRTERHRDYQTRYNTRIVRKPVPSIDTVLR